MEKSSVVQSGSRVGGEELGGALGAGRGGHPLLWRQRGRVRSSSGVLQERSSSWCGSEPQNRMNPFVCRFENYEVSFDRSMLTVV